MSNADWRDIARTKFTESVSELIATLHPSGEAEREQRVAALEQKARAEARAHGLPKWAPWEVCAYYLRFYHAPPDPLLGGAWCSAHLRLASYWRVLLTSQPMAGTWARLASRGVDALGFAVYVTDLAYRRDERGGDRRGLSEWEAQSRAERIERSKDIVKTVRTLLRRLQFSPAHGAPVFDFFDTYSAKTIAAHVLQNPAGVVAFLPDSPQRAIAQALPCAPTLEAVLEGVIREAECWQKIKPTYGRQDWTHPMISIDVKIRLTVGQVAKALTALALLLIQ